jgi:hypothetical protein
MSGLWLLWDVPDPGSGTPPPGVGEKLTLLLKWAMNVSLTVCVLGFIVTGATIAIQHRSGGGGDAGPRVGMVMVGCVVLGSATALVKALT